TPDTELHLYVTECNFAAPRLAIWRDGTSVLDAAPALTPGNTETTTPGGAYLTGNTGVVNRSVNGHFLQAGLVKTALSTADRQRLEGYLAHCGGIADNLPVDHPYKAAAPTL